MNTPLFSKKVIEKYPEIGKYLSIVYENNIKEYSIYTSLTDHFYVKDLSELTEEKIEKEIAKEKERREFQNNFFPEDWRNNDIENSIIKSVLANCK